MAEDLADQLARAERIKIGRSNPTIRGAIAGENSSDPTDVFRFSLNKSSFLTLTLTDLSDDARLELLDVDGLPILESDFLADASEVIVPPIGTEEGLFPRRLRQYFQFEDTDEAGEQFFLTDELPLRPGTYYVRISGASTEYKLNTSAVVDTRFPEGSKPRRFIDTDRLKGAKRIRIRGGTNTVTGDLDDKNTEDFWGFRLPQARFLVAFIRDLDANADLDLVLPNGRVATSSTRQGQTMDIINPNRSAPAGIYYLRVYRAGNDDTKYSLTLSTLRDPFTANLPETGQIPDLVRDIIPAAESSNPDDFVVLNEGGEIPVLLFAATSPSGIGRELYSSDGTLRGTQPLVDINPTGSSNPTELTVVTTTDGDVAYFAADDGVNGQELWRTDGTADGTFLVEDINPGIESSFVSNLVAVDDRVFFVANDGITGFELWVSDGTASGTSRVRDIISGSGSSFPSGLTAFNGEVYFAANDGIRGIELWRSDGTFEGTERVRDINLSGDSEPSDFAEFNGALYFSADNGTTGRELWRTDGTFEGTEQVVDIIIGAAGSAPRELTASGDFLYFSAFSSTIGFELWRTDGTAAGTTLVRDLNVGIDSSDPRSLIDVDGTLYFVAATNSNDPEVNRQIWSSDGTAGGTALLTATAPGNFAPDNLTPFAPTTGDTTGSFLYFAANTSEVGRELWRFELTTG